MEGGGHGGRAYSPPFSPSSSAKSSSTSTNSPRLAWAMDSRSSRFSSGETSSDSILFVSPTRRLSRFIASPGLHLKSGNDSSPAKAGMRFLAPAFQAGETVLTEVESPLERAEDCPRKDLHDFLSPAEAGSREWGTCDPPT